MIAISRFSRDNERGLDLSVEEVIIHKNFEKVEREIETFVSIEKLKNPQEYDSDFPFLRQLESFFIIRQKSYELPKSIIRDNGNTCHLFRPNNFGNVQHLYHDKACIDMTLEEFKLLHSTCWDQKNLPLTKRIWQKVNILADIV